MVNPWPGSALDRGAMYNQLSPFSEDMCRLLLMAFFGGGEHVRALQFVVGLSKLLHGTPQDTFKAIFKVHYHWLIPLLCLHLR